MLQFESLLLLKTRDQHGTRRLRRSQDSPKTVPRQPKTAQDASTRPRDGPETAQDSAKTTQDSSKTAQSGPKTHPRRPQDSSKTFWDGNLNIFFDDFLNWTLRHANLKYCFEDLINLRINMVHVCSHSLGHPIYLIFR